MTGPRNLAISRSPPRPASERLALRAGAPSGERARPSCGDERQRANLETRPTAVMRRIMKPCRRVGQSYSAETKLGSYSKEEPAAGPVLQEYLEES